MKVLFRVDSSYSIGTGHVVRCMALATSLREWGAEVSFLCRQLEGNITETLIKENFQVKYLPKLSELDSKTTFSIHGCESWLGVTALKEKEQSKEYIKKYGPYDWLVVDHYGIDIDWETEMYPYTTRLMVIDDLANRPHKCDLLIDQNYHPGVDVRYDRLVPTHCKKAIGPDYALLQKEYVECRANIRKSSSSIKNILVFFGGSDASNLTSLTIRAFKPILTHDMKLDVVIGVNHKKRSDVYKQSEGVSQIKIHEQIATLAHLMAKSDLFVGACGTTTWERCVLGLPSIVISDAENQTPIARALDQKGVIKWIGESREVSLESLGQSLSNALVHESYTEMIGSCMELVDGYGSVRANALMTLDQSTKIRFRLANQDDTKIYLRWFNDKDVRDNSFNRIAIDHKQHQEWFQLRLSNPSRYKLYVAYVYECIPIGQVRFEKTSVGWKINYSLDSLFRGCGIGRTLVEGAIRRFQNEVGNSNIIAEVIVSNSRSTRILEEIGFRAIPSMKKGSICYCLFVSRENLS